MQRLTVQGPPALLPPQCPAGLAEALATSPGRVGPGTSWETGPQHTTHTHTHTPSQPYLCRQIMKAPCQNGKTRNQNPPLGSVSSTVGKRVTEEAPTTLVPPEHGGCRNKPPPGQKEPRMGKSQPLRASASAVK